MFRNKMHFLWLVILAMFLFAGNSISAKAGYVTAGEVAQIEKKVSRMEIEVPVTETGVGYRCNPRVIFYPSASTGLDVQTPVYSGKLVEGTRVRLEECLKWKSSDESVISIKGATTPAIVAVGEGSATVTVRLGTIEASVTFHVSAQSMELSISDVVIIGIQGFLDGSDAKEIEEVTEGEDFDLIASFVWEGTSGNYYTDTGCLEYKDLFRWTSSDESVVSVKNNRDGRFRAMKPGETVITLTGPHGCNDTLTVIVKDDKKIDWVSPAVNDYELEQLTEKKGVVIHTKKQLYRYVYDQLSAGNYQLLVIYPEEYLTFNLKEEMDKAVEMYSEYIIEDEVSGYHNHGSIAVTGFGLSAGRKGIAVVIYNAGDEKAMVKKLNTRADAVLKKIIRKGMTQKEKIQAIHDYIVKNCDYDMGQILSMSHNGKKYVNKKLSSPLAHSAYGALINKKAVCEGYAELFNLLARKAGIDSVMVTGFAGEYLHAWNMVKLNGVYRYIDTTWDDPVDSSKINWKNPFRVLVNKKVHRKYYCVSAKTLKKDHRFSEKSAKEDYKEYMKYSYGK